MLKNILGNLNTRVYIYYTLRYTRASARHIKLQVELYSAIQQIVNNLKWIYYNKYFAEIMIWL